MKTAAQWSLSSKYNSSYLYTCKTSYRFISHPTIMPKQMKTSQASGCNRYNKDNNKCPPKKMMEYPVDIFLALFSQCIAKGKAATLYLLIIQHFLPVRTCDLWFNFVLYACLCFSELHLSDR